MCMDEIFGYIDSILFSDNESGFTIARLKEPKQKDPTTVLGNLPSVQPGESIRCHGTWKHHPKHGRQFEISSFEIQAPSDLVGIQKYLESGMIKGIGPAYAGRIVKQFGTDTLKIIEETPERLDEISGLGPKRIELIRKCWDEQKSIRTVMIFLRGHGVSPAFAQKIFKAYGDDSIEKVQKNPYALAKEIFGIGFKIADGIAQGLGLAQDSPARIEAAIEHALWELSNEGHVCYPEADLIPYIEKMLNIEQTAIAERLKWMVENNVLIRDEEKIFVKPLYVWEVGIARELARIAQAPSALRGILAEKAVDWIEEKLHLKLAEEQKEAVVLGMKEKFLVLTGGPGTGKSTITKAILRISEKLTTSILLAAPTGRAAKRLAEITGKPASTIHSLLEMDFTGGGFKKNKENPLVCDLIIIDEASMIDTPLMYHLMRAIPSSARVIFIGDIDQLPSVGPGNILKDMIRSECLPVCRLQKIFRQAEGSKIVTNAHLINQGEFPDLRYTPGSDFLYFEVEDPEEIVNKIVDLVRFQLPKSHRFHRFDEIQVLAPMRRGVIGIENLNIVLQKALNPSEHPLIRMGRLFHVGDKVMQIRNNYEKNVFNGDVGKIVEINLSEQNLKVAYEDKWVDYGFDEMDELVLAYAVSIHKYQGSECPCIIIPIHTTHFKLLHRNLLYTGITRGKKLVVLVGTKKAIGIAIGSAESKQRYTGLEKRIREFLSPVAASER